MSPENSKEVNSAQTWRAEDLNQQKILRSSTPVRKEAVTDSLHSLETGPVIKKELLKEIMADKPEKKAHIPRNVANNVKKLLENNASGIWVSRFLVEYAVSGVQSAGGLR